MEIHYFATIPLERDEPITCIRKFARVLRNCTMDAEHAQVDLNLIGSSARARTTIREFQPERTKQAAFLRALEVTEELTNLGVAKTKSLHFLLSAEGFRWKGSKEGSSAKLALLDAKSFQRNQRFHLSAHLLFAAAGPEEPFIENMLVEIANATGIRFEKDASITSIHANEPGRATPEELFATTLAWRELIETVGERVREKLSLEGVPHLMTTYEAHDFLFDPAKFGKSVPVNFSRAIRKWTKKEFPDYRRVQDAGDAETLHKEIAEGVTTTLGVDKRPKAFSKEFTIRMGVGLTSPRFAPASNRPFELHVNLFHLFGIGPLPMQWTYYTETDLLEALKGSSLLVKKVLAIFEPAAVQMQHAYKRRLEEFRGPRTLSAREAYDLVLPSAKAWAEDAALTGINSMSISGPYLSGFHVSLAALNEQGRLASDGGWHLRFHSRRKQENLHVAVPCHGSITQTRLDAPEGRQWPSDTDQVLRDGWLDSIEALRLAKAKARDVSETDTSMDPQLFELASRANLVSTGAIQLPLRNGMFVMEPSWRISFSRTANGARTIVIVTLPAYGDAPPTAEAHAFDKHGRTRQL
jgi:hypothetical protein